MLGLTRSDLTRVRKHTPQPHTLCTPTPQADIDELVLGLTRMGVDMSRVVVVRQVKVAKLAKTSYCTQGQLQVHSRREDEREQEREQHSGEEDEQQREQHEGEEEEQQKEPHQYQQ